jgi:hypothetical protein
MNFLKIQFSIFLLLISSCGLAQSLTEKEVVLSKLNYVEVVPEGLLSKRAIVLYDVALSKKELEETQKAFQQIGIDAVAYMITDRVLAGPDPMKSFNTILTNRAIDFLIFFEKEKNYSITITRYNSTKDLVEKSSPAWRITNATLSELLTTIFRLTINNQKNKTY